MQAVNKAGYRKYRASQQIRTGPNIKSGMGIACGFIPSVGVHSSAAYVKINEDGKVVLITGAQDTGSGALTGLAMIVAEELGVKLEDVIIQPGDTDFSPWDGGSQGSRTTFVGGNAVLSAAREAKERLVNAAGFILGVGKDRMHLENGTIRVIGKGVSMSYAEVVAKAQSTFGGPIVGSGSFVQDFPEYDKSTIEGSAFAPSFHDPTFVAHIASVEVDVRTGKIRLVRYVAAQDLGFCINPLGAEGQIQGGVAQGVGYALFEEMLHDDSGLTTNSSFGEYKLPTILDVPMIETIIVEGHLGSGPYGAKGVGEANIVPPAGAIANALADATGAHVNSLPLTPERVLEAIGAVSSGQPSRTRLGRSWQDCSESSNPYASSGPRVLSVKVDERNRE